MTLEAERVTSCTKVLQFVHWMYVYSYKVWISILAQWESLKALDGTLYNMKLDKAAPHDRGALQWA
jgi:hypothetical protein